MRDKATKGRTGRSKLSDIEVAEIKLLLDSGDHTQAQVASWYGVSPGTIRDINQGRTYRHVEFESVLIGLTTDGTLVVHSTG